MKGSIYIHALLNPPDGIYTMVSDVYQGASTRWYLFHVAAASASGNVPGLPELLKSCTFRDYVTI